MNKELIKEFSAQEDTLSTAFCETLLERYEYFKETKVVPDVELDYEILTCADKTGFIHGYIEKTCGVEPKCKIHAVKRLSDGEVFTVRDRAKKDEGDDFSIVSFDLTGGELIVMAKLGFRYKLSELKHIPKEGEKPLFVSKDNANIFDGDNYYGVWQDFSIHYYTARENEQVNNIQQFLLKENAEIWVLQNKPCLSYADVMFCGMVSFPPEFCERIKELVKQRI